jgi:hypothetical protein
MTVSGARKVSRGRPRVNATPVNVRLPPAELGALDAWIAAQPEPQPTRPEAVRRLLAVALAPDKVGEQVGLSISKVETALAQESEIATVPESSRLRTKPPKSG